MAHRSVEIVIGRLLTDASFRRRFARAPEAAIQGLSVEGIRLSAVEMKALCAISPQALGVLADSLDPRLQRAARWEDTMPGDTPAERN